MRTGIANLPLHYGKAPKWLFSRMVKLSELISEIIINEYGTGEFLKRLSDPFFFQAFSCVLGYDWHSSGTTTVTCGALKEALNKGNFEIKVCGGKGKVSRKTPEEIINSNLLTEKKRRKFQRISRLVAKIDNSLIQDGFSLYHHTFIFDKKGNWAVIQQGMDGEFARRYHWFSPNTFFEDPHSGICCDLKKEKVMNLASKESKETREKSLEIIQELTLPKTHLINRKLYEKIKLIRENEPKNYEDFILIKGVGPKTIRAIALISNLIYGSKIDWNDPVKYSFAHGGKDGIPYPVNKVRYDESINILKKAIEDAKIGRKEKISAIRRLVGFY